MPNGYIVVTRQVRSALAVEEAVDLLLGLVLGGELRCHDLLPWILLLNLFGHNAVLIW